MIRIENWSLIYNQGNSYQAPEMFEKRLHGEVYNHPSQPDGNKVYTSSIIKIEGRIITTFSGSVYILGKPEESYVTWCRENNHNDPNSENPFGERK